MNKKGSAAKVKLSSFDDLFGTEQPQTGTEQVQEIALSELHEFKGHPFKVLDDEKMQETVESVREHGVLMPGIARPMKMAVMRLLPDTAGDTPVSLSDLLQCRCSSVIIRMMKLRLSW